MYKDVLEIARRQGIVLENMDRYNDGIIGTEPRICLRRHRGGLLGIQCFPRQ